MKYDEIVMPDDFSIDRIYDNSGREICTLSVEVTRICGVPDEDGHWCPYRYGHCPTHTTEESDEKT